MVLFLNANISELFSDAHLSQTTIKLDKFKLSKWILGSNSQNVNQSEVPSLQSMQNQKINIELIFKSWSSWTALINRPETTVIISYLKSTILWDIMLCNPVEVHQGFGWTYCLHLQATSKKQAATASLTLQTLKMKAVFSSAISINFYQTNSTTSPKTVLFIVNATRT
jgi:hypothetical protein